MALKNWKLIGMLVTVLGAGLSVASGIIEDKKMEETIEEKVDEALARRSEEEEI